MKKYMKKLIDRFILCDTCGSRGKWAEPKKIIYTDNIKDGFGGYCKYGIFGVAIKVRPKYIGDRGLIAHEIVHARQFGRLLWLHSLFTVISGTYRLLVELQAYREQVKAYGYKDESEYEWIVRSLYWKYDTGYSRKEIREYADYCFADIIKENR